MNENKAPGAKQSSRMDFSRPDAADATRLNTLLWQNAKGGVAMPAARNGDLPIKTPRD
jgi:hypothetical protein